MNDVEALSDRCEVAFVVTKPIQLVFAVGIIRQLELRDAACLIMTDDFKDAYYVCRRASEVDWDLSSVGIKFCADRSDAERIAAKLGAKQIFVDSDVGLKRFLLLLRTQIRIKRPRIWVYEEGVGTYRTDLYEHGLKRRIFDVVGVGTRFGGSRFTSGIFVRDPDRFRKLFPNNSSEVRHIECTPSEMLSENLEQWSEIFGYRPVSASSESACALYLSNWLVHQSGLEHLRKFLGDRYFKPHPHIKTLPEVTDIALVSATAPAELVLMDLLEKYTCVTVFHHGSSVEHYVTDERIAYVRL